MPKRSAAKPSEREFRVAVVEEIADDIYSIKFVLQSFGYKVLSFSASSSYLEPLLQFKPQIVIVDMMIPAEGGYRVIREIRGRLSVKLPILAITAAAMKGDDGDVLKAGGTETLAKPYAITELQRKLRKLDK